MLPTTTAITAAMRYAERPPIAGAGSPSYAN